MIRSFFKYFASPGILIHFIPAESKVLQDCFFVQMTLELSCISHWHYEVLWSLPPSWNTFILYNVTPPTQITHEIDCLCSLLFESVIKISGRKSDFIWRKRWLFTWQLRHKFVVKCEREKGRNKCVCACVCMCESELNNYRKHVWALAEHECNIPSVSATQPPRI